MLTLTHTFCFPGPSQHKLVFVKNHGLGLPAWAHLRYCCEAFPRLREGPRARAALWFCPRVIPVAGWTVGPSRMQQRRETWGPRLRHARRRGCATLASPHPRCTRERAKCQAYPKKGLAEQPVLRSHLMFGLKPEGLRGDIYSRLPWLF